jgi:transcription elongation factor GreA
MSYNPISAKGLSKLKEELNRLQTVERPNIIKAIEEARAHGDLSENAEYHAAKERQNQILARIDDLQMKVSTSKVVVNKGPFDKCVFGATVTVENAETEAQRTYVLVGPFESDPEHGFLSIASPMGKALLGLTEGDDFLMTIPSGEEEYRVLSIK